MEKSQSDFSFKFMSLGFKFRDIIKPRKNVLKESGIKEGSHVLDFGCGPGGYILPLAKMIGESGKIFALDINPQALQAVRNIAAKNRLTIIETIHSDGATGLPVESIDIVLLYDILHHLNQSDDVLAELHRVLNPNGTLSMSDHHMTEEQIISKITGSGHFKLSRRGKKVYNFSRV